MNTLDVEHLSVGQDEPIPAEWRHRLTERARSVFTKKSQIIVAQGSASDEVYLIDSGRVQFSIISKNGRETIFSELGAGYLFGELSAIDMKARSVSAISIENCHLYQISAHDFREFLMENSEAAFWITKQLARRTRYLTEKTFELATMSVSSRLQIELLRLGLENGEEDDVVMINSLPTHSALAARIGTHREAVTRELGLLADEGIVKQSGRQLTISSVQKLQKLLSRTR